MRFGKVFISRSQCIFENLAFEEWLLRNHNCSKNGEVMLLWSNKPAVVIGRHQNPWKEVNFPYIRQNGIAFARRHSGGGAVYHDLGNLNISILTEHSRHCRIRNLEMISSAVNEAYNVQVSSNSRQDLNLQPGDRKISGTAARISREMAYHHMTLLVSVDLSVLKTALKSPFKDSVFTKATSSVSAPAVGFLNQDDPSVTVESLTDVVAEAFRRQYEDSRMVIVPDITDELHFPGVGTNEHFLRSYQWLYGKSPAFSARCRSGRLVNVEKGIITKVEDSTQKHLIGQKFQTDFFMT
ncbi:hypothetical protein AB6A40_000656 [Gnathostoma spinigerum]|uniref:BPL/LPL catalytic domain-containing protein n=1 Tax=Gnathostoma spinigerum TaxID=75299 RepID=A0ABD6E4L2_9BILA